MQAAFGRPWRWQADLVAATRAGYEGAKAAGPDIRENLEAYNAYYRERETEAWYLQELSVAAKDVEAAVAKGDAWGAVEEAMRMGELYTELRLKFGSEWEQRALLGVRTQEERQRGGGANRKHPDAAYLASYRKFRDSGLGKSDATDMAAGQLQVSPATIRNARKRAGTSD